MSSSNEAAQFSGSVPHIYERYLVPLIFEFYADDLCSRVATLRPLRVLEVAAGTGVVTRRLANALDPEAVIVATDLAQPMLEKAATTVTGRSVQWRQADAMKLPFADASFDVVVCQFGAMFFPDKAKAFDESRRVLKSGGSYIFNVWDRVEDNEFADVVTRSIGESFPNNPPQFLARVPHGYHNVSAIAADLAAGGFRRAADIVTMPGISRAQSPRIAAIAFCQGTPMRGEIEARDATRLDEVTDTAEAAITRRFGSGAIQGRMQAHVITAQRD